MKNLIGISMLLVLFLTNCDFNPKPCDPKDVKKAFAKAHFNKAVLKNITNYITFGNFLQANRMEIIDFTNKILSDKVIISDDHIKKTGMKYYSDSESYSFSSKDLMNRLPPALRAEFIHLYKNIDRKLIYAFSLDRDGSVTIKINNNSELNEDNVGIVQEINFFTEDQKSRVFNNRDSSMIDTMLNKKWHYTIYANCYEGF